MKLPALMAWQCLLVGLLIWPLIPALGAVFIILAIFINGKEKYQEIIKNPFNWGLLIYSIWLIITCFFAYYPHEAFLGLVNLLPFILLLVSFSQLISKPSQLRQLAWVIIAPCLLIIILGCGQLYGDWHSPQLLVKLFGWELIAKGEPEGRMASVFTYANILAAYLLIVFFLAIGLYLELTQFRTSPSKNQKLLLAFLSLTIMGDILGLVLTSSRNAWLIAFFGCLIFALYLGWRFLVLSVLSAAASVFWASFGVEPSRGWLRQIIPAYFWARLNDDMYPDRPVATLRKTQWLFCWDLTQQRPWMGWGLRNFSPIYQARTHELLGHPHNLFLMFLAETGIPATLLLLSLVGWVMAKATFLLGQKRIWLQKQDRLIFFSYLLAFTGCIVFNLFDISLFDLRVNALSWLLLSAITGVVFRYDKISLGSNDIDWID